MTEPGRVLPPRRLRRDAALKTCKLKLLPPRPSSVQLLVRRVRRLLDVTGTPKPVQEGVYFLIVLLRLGGLQPDQDFSQNRGRSFYNETARR